MIQYRWPKIWTGTCSTFRERHRPVPLFHTQNHHCVHCVNCPLVNVLCRYCHKNITVFRPPHFPAFILLLWKWGFCFWNPRVRILVYHHFCYSSRFRIQTSYWNFVRLFSGYMYFELFLCTSSSQKVRGAEGAQVRGFKESRGTGWGFKDPMWHRLGGSRSRGAQVRGFEGHKRLPATNVWTWCVHDRRPTFIA